VRKKTIVCAATAAAALAWSLCTAGDMSAWEAYIRNPTPDNAAHVKAISYGAENGRFEQQERDLMMLEVQVLSRDPAAVRLAFRLRLQADGHFGEMLDIMLGRLIRIDAPLFLREGKRAEAAIRRLDSLVGNFGPEYVDRPQAQAYEAAQRIAALRKVSDAGLKPVRDKCIASLEKSGRKPAD
jgi:hypothetical protein